MPDLRDVRRRYELAPPMTPTEKRLDVLIAGIDRLCDLLTPPAAPEPPAEDQVVRVELREPERAAESAPVDQAFSRVARDERPRPRPDSGKRGVQPRTPLGEKPPRTTPERKR